ncbi:MurR/RpiR family transcriptional regulator [Moorella sp. Hama-1]|uniref:MurR/RpiR family transcriptional regulator n=1 Tax=Moorella sp. Hama-1 TaxID=2138101 RepID=UPI0019124AB0|nr:MurR/RpiR family transcriptional regulator [Moorella sp. Hama-1]BCV22342.1 RpiR family transcriptional regulator [Moorella sp. Hama-1]
MVPVGVPDVSNSQLSASSFMARLRGIYRNLRASEKKVVDYIMANPEAIIHLSISDLADASQVSEATIVRLCKKLGFNGYQDLKITFAQDLVAPIKNIHEEVTPEDAIGQIKDKVFRSNLLALEDTLKTVADEELERAAGALVAARRIQFMGVGGSSCIAHDAYLKFLKTGIPCSLFTDGHSQVVGASLATPDDVVIAISHSGSSKDVVQAAELARENGATTIAITQYSKSPLVKHADICLFTSARETAFRTEAMSSRIAQLTIIDTLYVKVALELDKTFLENLRKIRHNTTDKRF